MHNHQTDDAGEVPYFVHPVLDPLQLDLLGQTRGETDAHRKQAKVCFGQKLLHRRAGLFAIVHVMADEFVQRPSIERLLERLEANQIVRRQVRKTIRQSERQQRAVAAQDHEVQPLLLQRQINLRFDRDRRASEEIHPGQAEEPMPGLWIHGQHLLVKHHGPILTRTTLNA